MSKFARVFSILLTLTPLLAAVTDDREPWLPVPEGPLQRIAFGSCSNQYLAQPIWDTLAEAAPDLFLHLGDIVYADAAPPGTRTIPPGIDVIEKMKMDYAFLESLPGFAKLKRAVPVMATWDDHDFGRNDGGGDFELKDQSREVFFDFIGAPVGSERRKTKGVYEAEIIGPPGRRVQVIMLDTRYFRDPLVKGTLTREQAKAKKIVGRFVPNPDPGASLLGEAQWKWLEDQLRKSAEVRLLVSSIQVVAGEKGAESWGNFPHERKRLYDLIGRTGATGVLLMSGDVHFAELSMTDEGPYPLYDFTSSPLAQYPVGMTGWESCINGNRISDAYARDNFGMVDIDWEARPVMINLKIIGTNGSTAFEHRISLDSLQSKE